MITYSTALIKEMIVHFVGNPSLDEPLTISETQLEINDNNHEILVDYLLKSFKPEAYYHFAPGNLVYDAINMIFKNSGEFNKASEQIASHLYDVSSHPKILSGDLFVAQIEKVNVNSEFYDAIVLLKAESEDKFLQVEWAGNQSTVEFSEAYRLDRIDKACLILSADPGDGYRVLVVDKTNGNNAEAQYWVDAFLELEAVEDSYHHTAQYMNMTREFVKEQLPEDFQVNASEQIALLNRTSKFFKEKDAFEFNNFADEVLKQPEVVSAFRKFTDSYNTEDGDHSVTEAFDINQTAVKKHAGMFKSILKLDKNFHVYVHGNRQLIEKGFDDEKGMNYYKLYFSNEAAT
jgi:hypothetical protein